LLYSVSPLRNWRKPKLTEINRSPTERPTADVLLSQHPFCELDPNYSFLDTDLYAKIRGTY